MFQTVDANRRDARDRAPARQDVHGLQSQRQAASSLSFSQIVNLLSEIKIFLGNAAFAVR